MSEHDQPIPRGMFREPATAHQEVLLIIAQGKSALKHVAGKISNIRRGLVMDELSTDLLRQHLRDHATNLFSLADGLPKHEKKDPEVVSRGLS